MPMLARRYALGRIGELLQHGEHAGRLRPPGWIMEEIDAGERDGRHISKAHAHQAVVVIVQKLAGKGPCTPDILLDIGLWSDGLRWPAPRPMHVRMVGVVESQMGRRDGGSLDEDLNGSIPLQSTALAA